MTQAVKFVFGSKDEMRGSTWNKKFKSCLEGHLIIKQFQDN